MFLNKRYCFLFSLILSCKAFSLSFAIAVSNDSLGTVIKIDQATQSIEATVELNEDLQCVAITPDGKEAYVMGSSTGIFVLDTATLALQNTIPLDGCGPCLAISPDGKLLYALKSDGDDIMYSIDITASIPTISEITLNNDEPYSIIFTVDGKYAYVMQYGYGEVDIVNTSNTSDITTLSVGSSPYFAAITPDNKSVYVVNYSDGDITVINNEPPFNTSTITPSGLSSPYPIAISPNGEYAYIGNYLTPGEIVVLDMQTNTTITTIPVADGGDIYYIAFTSDGKYAYAAFNAGNVIAIDTSTHSATSYIFNLSNAIWVATSPAEHPNPQYDKIFQLIHNMRNYSRVIPQK